MLLIGCHLMNIFCPIDFSAQGAGRKPGSKRWLVFAAEMGLYFIAALTHELDFESNLRRETLCGFTGVCCTWSSRFRVVDLGVCG
jgi:hypothetical protein